MSKRAINNLKMIILVVLFLTTILLLYFVWGKDSSVKVTDIIPSFSADSSETEMSFVEIHPREIYYTKGDGAFRCVSSLIPEYEHAIDYLKNFCSLGTVMAAEITEEQYSEAVRMHEACIFNFSYCMPFSEFCIFYGISRTSSTDNISAIDSFAFSSAAEDSVLLANHKDKRYYRLLSDVEQENYALCKEYTGDINYYDINTILGVSSGKLIPISSEISASDKVYDNFIFKNSNLTSEIARVIFGDTFNFVRRITDSFGNQTYMYGYGKKTLSVSAEGVIEYKNESSDDSSDGFFGDLKTAVNFLGTIGINTKDLSSVQGSGCLYLTEAESTGSGKSASYTYIFSESNEYTVCGIENPYIEISVKGGSVTAMKARLVIPRDEAPLYAEKYTSGSAAGLRSTADVANIIAANSVSQEDMTAKAELLDSVNIVYYMQPTEGIQTISGKSAAGALVPAWQFKFNDESVLYFDLFSGTVLK